MVQIVRSKELCDRLCVSRMTIWRWAATGNFPAPIQLGPKVKGWDVAEVEKWIESRQTGHRKRPSAASGTQTPG